MFHTRPLRWGFVVTLGVLGALLLALILVNLQNVLLSVFIAMFIALGLDPLIRWFQRRGLKRGGAIVAVILLFIVVVVGLVWAVVPSVVTQIQQFVVGIPNEIVRLQSEAWFENLSESTGGIADHVTTWVSDAVADPKTWATIGGGALAFGLAVADGISTSIFVFILTIYFVATLDTMKRAGYELVAASQRQRFVSYAERIMDSVGRYLSGMVVLAFCNAVFSFILLTVVGVPYALVVAVVALFITLIPLVGTVITTALMTVIALFTSPAAAIIVLATMLVYMQVEAYLLTPRVMGKAVQVPGSVVLISALAGGTLLGLLGALVAIPISAAIILIIREIVVPAKARA
ncbi:AI-2E family transporter [Luethyella okanaganae]|uniref:AI-2E family transporter n=1 Tax=Luethyella okanaganae TaxID=69372 RepID=A0ABW1VHF3_9MICO